MKMNQMADPEILNQLNQPQKGGAAAAAAAMRSFTKQLDKGLRKGLRGITDPQNPDEHPFKYICEFLINGYLLNINYEY